MEKRECSCTVGGECKLIQPLWKTVWRFLKKLRIKLPYDPAIPLWGIYPEETVIEEGRIYYSSKLAEHCRDFLK